MMPMLQPKAPASATTPCSDRAGGKTCGTGMTSSQGASLSGELETRWATGSWSTPGAIGSCAPVSESELTDLVLARGGTPLPFTLPCPYLKQRTVGARVGPTPAQLSIRRRNHNGSLKDFAGGALLRIQSPAVTLLNGACAPSHGGPF